MLNKKTIKQILQTCLATGADFSEVFIEKSISNVYEMTKDKVTKASTNYIYGIGVRVLKGVEEAYGYTNDLSMKSVHALATRLASSFTGEVKQLDFAWKTAKKRNIIPVVKTPSSLTNAEKLSLLTKVNQVVSAYSPEITQVLSYLTDKEQTVTIANSKGTYVTDVRTNIRIATNAVASDGKSMQSASDNYGRNRGYELFDDLDLNEFATEVAKAAVIMLHADEVAGGKMTVVVHNGFGGVLLHEACVHSLEATSVAKGVSVFSHKLGQKIASDVVTAVDDGTIQNAWGSLNVDDEGNPTQKNVLIENGILKSYLVDYRNSLRMNQPITGSGRRQSYQYSPTSRMTNTFFAPGKSTFDEIITNTKFGLFAKKMGGGSVDPSTGQFNFAVNEGYLIEDGKITKPVKGATLIGSGAEVLKNIDMIADNLSYGQGMCGSASGSIPTDVGQPTIRVQNMTVGGRG
ncbi:MAG: TldD/PmbA family protein [Bacilli bacterium]|nr:TldD/PmbA family protein [Bacilli bacterium]